MTCRVPPERSPDGRDAAPSSSSTCRWAASPPARPRVRRSAWSGCLRTGRGPEALPVHTRVRRGAPSAVLGSTGGPTSRRRHRPTPEDARRRADPGDEAACLPGEEDELSGNAVEADEVQSLRQPVRVERESRVVEDAEVADEPVERRTEARRRDDVVDPDVRSVGEPCAVPIQAGHGGYDADRTRADRPQRVAVDRGGLGTPAVEQGEGPLRPPREAVPAQVAT